MAEEEQQINFEPITIRYDGLDAAEHKLDLAEFGKSAQGIAKIMATAAEFVITGNYQKTKRKLDCKVLVGSAQDNCISFETVIQALNEIDRNNAIFVGISVTVGSAFLIDCYRHTLKFLWDLITKKDKETSSKEELEKLLAKVHNKENSDKLLAIIEKMADGLVESAKSATHPINLSCNTIQFGDTNKNYFVKLDAADKKAIEERDYEYTDIQEHRVLISEIDYKKESCQVSLQDDLLRRFKAKIEDPRIEKANNTYGEKANAKEVITILARQKLYKQQIQEFIIYDIKVENDQTN